MWSPLTGMHLNILTDSMLQFSKIVLFLAQGVAAVPEEG